MTVHILFSKGCRLGHVMFAGLLVAALGGCLSSDAQGVSPIAAQQGEAKYFSDRCPQFRMNVKAVGEALAQCQARKDAACNEAAMADYMPSATTSYQRAERRYADMPDEKLCRIAWETYGENGSAIPGALLKR